VESFELQEVVQAAVLRIISTSTAVASSILVSTHPPVPLLLANLLAHNLPVPRVH